MDLRCLGITKVEEWSIVWREDMGVKENHGRDQVSLLELVYCEKYVKR